MEADKKTTYRCLIIFVLEIENLPEVAMGEVETSLSALGGLGEMIFPMFRWEFNDFQRDVRFPRLIDLIPLRSFLLEVRSQGWVLLFKDTQCFGEEFLVQWPGSFKKEALIPMMAVVERKLEEPFLNGS